MESVVVVVVSPTVDPSCLFSSQRMVRLRIGIGRPTGKASVEDYVLSRFTDAEQEVLPPVFERAATMLLQHIQQNCGRRESPCPCDGLVRAPPKTEGPLEPTL